MRRVFKQNKLVNHFYLLTLLSTVIVEDRLDIFRCVASLPQNYTFPHSLTQPQVEFERQIGSPGNNGLYSKIKIRIQVAMSGEGSPGKS